MDLAANRRYTYEPVAKLPKTVKKNRFYHSLNMRLICKYKFTTAMWYSLLHLKKLCHEVVESSNFYCSLRPVYISDSWVGTTSWFNLDSWTKLNVN